MDESDAGSLLCHENDSCFSGNEEEDEEYCSLSSETELKSIALLGFGDEDEYIESLIRREAVHEAEASVSQPPPPTPSFDHSLDSGSWWARARLDSIEWILNARAFLGFHYRTAYLAVTYLDRFLARRTIGDEKIWAMRLLSVACLSLAAKMEECAVPALSDFPTQRYGFESRVITRMEFLVLTTLDWKMSSITPFSYITFFIDKFWEKSCNRKELFSVAVELVFAASKEINLVEYRPSTIAAAAVLASSSAQLTRKVVELKIGVISSWGSLVSEHVLSCYDLMHEIKKKEMDKTPKERVSSPMVPSRSSSYASSAGNKRKRLQFNDNGQNISVKKQINRQ